MKDQCLLKEEVQMRYSLLNILGPKRAKVWRKGRLQINPYIDLQLGRLL